MLQSRERTDSYAAMGGRFVQKFHFMCISSGFPELLRSDMNAAGYRRTVAELFGSDLEDARICLTFVSAQAWYVAVQAGLPEKAADEVFDVYHGQIRGAGRVEQILDAFVTLMVSYAREVAILRQPRLEDDRIQQVVGYINANVCEPITARQVAEHLGFTQSYLSRAFKEKTGKTLVSFIQEAKVRNAKLLLRNQALSVTDVMERLGYVSQSHFTKVFREQTGLTPARYRARILEEPEDTGMTQLREGAWKRRLETYQALDSYGRQSGMELQQYLLACIRRGNVAALEEELRTPQLYTRLYQLFDGKVDVAMEAFLSTWPQAMHAAGDSGVLPEKAVECFSSFVMRLYGCVSVNEVLDLNCEYLLEMGRLVSNQSRG